MKTGLIVAVTTFVLTGCASIFSGTTQEVAIRSTPGASFAITNSYGSQVASGEAPANVELKRSVGYFSPHAYQLRLSKPGFKSRTLDIRPGMNPWYFGNILLGGVIGMVIVDPLTGAMFNLYPRDIDLPLEAGGEDAPGQGGNPAGAPPGGAGPTSRNDYMARQKAREMACLPVGDPTVEAINSPREIFSFSCQDGRTLVLRCSSGEGCSG